MTKEPQFLDKAQSIIRESAEISDCESNSSSYVPVITTESGQNIVNLSDLVDFSEKENIDPITYIKNICESNNLDNIAFSINESDYIRSDKLRILANNLQEYTDLYKIPIFDKNPIFTCADEAINAYAYYNDDSLLEAFVEDDFDQFYSILDESSRWMKETMKKQAQELVDKGQAPDLATANRIIEKEHGKKREENDATRVALERERFWSRRSRNPSDTAGYYVQTKTNMHGQQYKNNGRGFVQTSGSKRQYAKKGTYGKQPDKNVSSKAGTFKSDDGTFYGSHPNGDTVGKPDYNQSSDDYRFQKEKELDQKRKEQEELARKQKTEAEQKVPEQQQTQQSAQHTHDAANSSSQNDDKTNTAKNQESTNQKKPAAPPAKQAQSQQQDQQKEKQVESTINNMEKEAENKPAGFISSKIAALRKLYANWLAKKNQEKDQGKIGFFSNILRAITNCIDRLLAKLQGVKKAESDATNNSSAQQPNGNTQTAAKPATANG